MEPNRRPVTILIIIIFVLAVAGACYIYTLKSQNMKMESDMKVAQEMIDSLKQQQEKPASTAQTSAPTTDLTKIPTSVGQCVNTSVAKVTYRLEADGQPIVGSGSAVQYTNKIYGVSYEQVSAVDNSRSGDPVTLCLVSVPMDCPPGDERGKVYEATNLRTHEKWALPDAAHMCGGA
jgi:hypothetical protein